MKKRILSMILALTMVVGVLPISALAAEEEEVYVQTFELPVVEEGEEAPEPQGLGISAFALQANETGSKYIYEGVESVYTSSLTLLDGATGERLWTDEAEEPASNGLLQVVDGDGNILASNMMSYGCYTQYDSTEKRYYYTTSSVELTGLDELEAGVYALQLTAGSVTYPTSGKLYVVGEGCLLLSSAYLENFYAGCSEFDMRVALYGFETEEEAAELTFTVKDASGNVVATSSGAMKDTSVSSNGNVKYWYTYLQMKVAAGAEITSGTKYTVEIAYSGDKLLVDGVGSMTKSATTRRGSIAGFGVVDGQKGIVRVEIANWDSTKSYEVTVEDDGTICGSYEGLVPEDGIVTIQLMRNGMETSLNNYGSGFYVELCVDSFYIIDGENFDNPYYNLQNEYVYFYPYHFPANAKTVDFYIQIHNGCSYYEGKDDVLVVRDSSGNEVGRCEDMTLDRVNGNNAIVGTLTLTGTTQANKTHYVYLNDVQFDTVYITNRISAVTNVPMVEYGSSSAPGTMWTNFGVCPLLIKAVNTSGKAQIIIREKDGADVVSSGMLTGVECNYQYYLQYEYLFTAEQLSKLDSETTYLLILKDQNGEECNIGNNYGVQYTTEKTELDLTNYNHIYVDWYDMGAGGNVVDAILYVDSSSARNITKDDLEVLKNLTLVSENDGTVYSVIQLGEGSWNDNYYQYSVPMTMDQGVPAGSYYVLYNGKAIDTAYISETSQTPRIWDGNTNGMVSGVYLNEKSVYTCKIYDGYTCLTNGDLPMTLSGACDGETQYLIYGKEALADLEEGTYELRVYQDGKLLGTVSLSIVLPTKPILIIDDYDYDWSDTGDTVLHAREVQVEFSNMGAYTYIRMAETKEALAATDFEAYRSGYWYGWEFEGEDGPRKLYVELSMSGKADDEKNALYENDLYLCLNGDYGLAVPEDIQGIKDYYEYTITATTAVSPARVMVYFYDAAGNYARNVMNFVSRDDDGTSHYELTFYPKYDSIYDDEYTSSDGYGYFEYSDTVMVEFVATDMSEADWVNGSSIGNIRGESIKRVLLFGDPESVILPQFMGDDVYTNQDSFTIYGYATAETAITINGEAGGVSDEYGFFTVEVTGLTEGTKYITVSDGIIGSTTARLYVDKTAPSIKEASFTYLTGGNAVLNWVCSAGDVDHFEIYRNDKRIGTAAAGSTSYNVMASLEDGYTYYVKAVDYAGNVGELSLTTEDTEAPETVTGIELSAATSTSITLKWTVPYDNAGVQKYEIYRGETKVGESTSAAYTDTGLEAVTEYTYTIYACDGAGNKSAASVAFTAKTLEGPIEGTCGENLTWILENGVLTISGTGAMTDYDACEAPWYAYTERITEVVMESGVTTIGENAFYGLADVTSVTIPEGVTSLGSWAFVGCNTLTSVTLPASLNEYGYTVFGMCWSLTAINVAEGNETFASQDGILFSKDMTVLYDCPKGKALGDYTVPATVKTIGVRAFSDCHGLTGVTLPKGLTTIGEEAFDNTSLTEIEIPRSVTEIADAAFRKCYNLTDVYFKGNAPALGENVFTGCSEELTIHYVSNKTGFDGESWKDLKTETSAPVGVAVSGTVTSYKPAKETVVQLVQNGEVIHEETIAAGEGSKKTSASVTLESVEEGTYDMVVKKDGCLDYTVKDFVVSDEDVDLGESGKAYADIQLVAGDINNDNRINLTDLAKFREDFGKTGENITEDNCDMDGDGRVNLTDLSIFRENFGKTSENNCTVDF